MAGRTRRANSMEIRHGRRRRRRDRTAVKDSERREGREAEAKTTVANHLCRYESAEQERSAREQAVVDKVAVLRAKLPVLLRRLSKIPDPRNPKKIKHMLSSLMLYGILGFVLQVASRREANRELTRPVFRENLIALFPELESIAHHDTLMRLLDRIDVEQIQEAHGELVRSLIRKRKFAHLLVEGCYPIAIDGTQKFATYTLWDEQYLERQVGDEKARRTQYYIYVVEANFVFTGGITIPLMSEFLDYREGDSGREKQDCELRGFYRMINKLHRAFPRLPIMLLLDGLYPVGPAMEQCQKYGWEFMIVLQNGCLPQIWEEYEGLKNLLEDEDRHRMNWGAREQRFHWVNGIEYSYGVRRGKRRMKVHIVVCHERWREPDPAGARPLEKKVRHVWLSNRPLSKDNVHPRCNLAARHRWGIELGILVEKHQGYHYEHCFAYSGQAMKGYHYLMRIAHLMNVLAHHSTRLAGLVKELGTRGLIRFIRHTLSAPWIDRSAVQRRLSRPCQLRLVT